MNMNVVIIAIISLPVLDNQMPSRPINRGITITVIAWYRNKRKNDKIADTRPLPRAVKNADPKILKPTIKKQKE